MTEPTPHEQYDYGQHAERQVQREIVERLRGAGWMVAVNSQPGKVRKQLRGLPDLLAWRADVSLLIECKSITGLLNEAQVDFLEHIDPHAGPHLIYLVARYPADVDVYCQPPQTEYQRCPECPL